MDSWGQDQPVLTWIMGTLHLTYLERLNRTYKALMYLSSRLDGNDFTIVIETFNASETTHFKLQLNGFWKRSVTALHL